MLKTPEIVLQLTDWTPIWEENADPVPFHGRRYQDYSIQLVNRSHPHLNATEAEALAKQQYLLRVTNMSDASFCLNLPLIMGLLMR